MLNARLLVTILLLAGPSGASAQTRAPSPQVAPSGRVSQLTAIPLRSGVNRVGRFSQDGREAQIILGWRDNGNAHGYDVFLVLMPSRAGGSDWNVVGLEAVGDARFQDVIRDQPHTGDDMVRSVRFARGRLDGAPATLLLTATRDPSDEGIPAPSLVTFEVLRLTASAGEVGVTRDYFAVVERRRSTTAFCNAEIALAREFALPPRTQPDWPSTPNGCPR